MNPEGATTLALAQTTTAGRARSKVNARSLAALAIALAMPIVIHMAPWGGAVPLGAFLLPMFWAAFVAVYLYGPAAGLAVALFGPTVNTFLTRFPALKFNTVMSFELVVFVVFAWLVLRNPRGRSFWLLAPFSYLVAKTCSCALAALHVGTFADIDAPAQFFIRSITNGAPGLLVLALINFALVRGWFGNNNGGHGPEQAA